MTTTEENSNSTQVYQLKIFVEECLEDMASIIETIETILIESGVSDFQIYQVNCTDDANDTVTIDWWIDYEDPNDADMGTDAIINATNITQGGFIDILTNITNFVSVGSSTVYILDSVPFLSADDTEYQIIPDPLDFYRDVTRDVRCMIPSLRTPFLTGNKKYLNPMYVLFFSIISLSSLSFFDFFFAHERYTDTTNISRMDCTTCILMKRVGFFKLKKSTRRERFLWHI